MERKRLDKFLYFFLSGLSFTGTESTKDSRGTEVAQHEKWSIPLGISSVNKTKSISCGFGHIYRRNLELFQDGGPCNLETSPLICSANQWTGFYMFGTSVIKELMGNFIFCAVGAIFISHNHLQLLNRVRLKGHKQSCS